MSFLTETFDEFRPHPIRKTKMCRPENRWAKLEGQWLDPKKGTEEKVLSEEEIEDFIKKTMKSLRGQSTYFNDHCSYLSQEFKTRPFKPREKRKKPCKEAAGEVVVEPEVRPQAPKLAMKDTELMKVAKELYEPDPNKRVLQPLATHYRILGYVRPFLYRTGISDYQHGIARLAYELTRDDRLPRYHAHNGGRPRWPYPPEGRQPELDAAPFDGEKLY